MTIEKVRALLDHNQVRYVTIRHSQAYTALEIAASAHVPGKELAKTVIVRVDGKMVMAVLPASEKVDFESLRKCLGARTASLVPESEFEHLFPDCEVGAMPPFGNMYGLDVYVTESLAKDFEIAFNAGTHTELIRMRFRDYARLVRPKVLSESEMTMM